MTAREQGRLDRLEAKVDRLMEDVAGLRVTVSDIHDWVRARQGHRRVSACAGNRIDGDGSRRGACTSATARSQGQS